MILRPLDLKEKARAGKTCDETANGRNEGLRMSMNGELKKERDKSVPGCTLTVD